MSFELHLCMQKAAHICLLHWNVSSCVTAKVRHQYTRKVFTATSMCYSSRLLCRVIEEN